MASYTLQPVDGEQLISTRNSGDLYHDVAIRANNATAGTITLTARKAGSDVFETIPDAVFDLTALETVQFTGGVTQYKVTIAGITGATSLYLTDTSQRA